MQKRRKIWGFFLTGIIVMLFMLCPVATAGEKVVVNPLGSDRGIEIPTVKSAGQVWMDRNLGASRVAGSPSDSIAYGWLYQWGRPADGHESRTSPTTGTLSIGNVPGHGNFITMSSSPFDWRSSQNDNLWQGVSGVNNPCPAGFRVPTETEWETERDSWSSNDSAGAFASPLKLVVAGYRYPSSGNIGSAGSYGYYWSSTAGGGNANYLFLSSGSAYMSGRYRAYGFCVRCLKD